MSDQLQAFKKHIAFKLRSCKEHIPMVSRRINLDNPREAAAAYRERTELVAEAIELQAVLDYLRDYEAEQAYNARTAQMLA